MLIIIVEFVIVIIGLAVIPILFYRFPKLPETRNKSGFYPKVSVIIPARNEEKNLPLILEDLYAQSLIPYEIICVDDESSDETAQIAKAYGVRVISLHNKPEGWTGKTWACHNGANASTGECLLFLDADVRLGRDGLLRLMQTYSEYGCTISVQPYHKTEKAYEQLSIMFNLVQIAANGTALPKPLGVGLYGPVILISKFDYNRIGGHEGIRKSVVEDMDLGHQLKQANISYRLFIGDSEMSFRMYGEGIRSLVQGWIKNMATGAVKTPLFVFGMVFFWIASLTSVPIQVIKFAVMGNYPWLVVYLLLYAVWVSILCFLSKSVGCFRLVAIVFYPIQIVVFLGVFAVSVLKKWLGLNVIWKGRAIAVREGSCK